MFTLVRRCALVLLGGLFLPQAYANTDMDETAEIVFCKGGSAPYTGCPASDLRLKADSLQSPVAIFEYLRNNYDFSLYQGARSGSVNTFLGGRGNDVDLAATLIAMLRSQGVPARYVVGTVRALPSKVANWLQVEDTTLAKSLLVDQGIQKVTSTTSGSTPTLDFEHVWVEALVPYGYYRGATPNAPNYCATIPAPSDCHWVPMDPSWKQYVQVSSGLDPYSTLSFDYTNYYKAIVNANTNGDLSRVNKNPLEIYQEQVMAWLPQGKSLEDIPDFRGIAVEFDGLLPASLPFALSSATRTYNSATDHDAAVPSVEVKPWTKYITVSPMYYGSGYTVALGGVTVSLVEASTQRLTLTLDSSNGSVKELFRLGGTDIGGGFISDGTMILGGQAVAVGFPFTLDVQMDGAPDPTGGANDYLIKASYRAVVGGYYLVATGGESSNWSQVHRAAKQVLDASSKYPIVFDSSESGCDVNTGLNCTPYVGSVATTNTLMGNQAAMDDLTGGLLYVAGTQYFAKLRDDFAVAGRINKIVTPIEGFLGVVSSTYEPAEYINGTAFSILPSGLLIDMKGISIGGNWRINAPSTYSNSQFNFLGHIGSSLEHETWQELTGYDAISTVRGIQMALANGATLVDAKKNSTTDTMATAYTAFGFANGAAPSGFTYTPYTMPFGGTQPATWTNATSGAAFDVMMAQESSATSALRQSRKNYFYSPSSGLYGWVNCVYSQASQLQTYINQGYSNSHFTGTYNLCDGTGYSTAYTVSQIYAGLQSNYANSIIPNRIGQTFFNYFDRAQGFAPTAYVYRATPIGSNAQFTSLIQRIRDDLYLQDLSKVWVQYILPSQQSGGVNYKFAVDIRNVFDTPSGNVLSTTFEILNNTGVAAGGSFVAVPPRYGASTQTGGQSNAAGENQ